jgi:predicted transcriptional regulator
MAQHEITPAGYVAKEADDLDEIPPYLRERIQAIIDRKVAEKIDEEMAAFKEEIRE